MSLPAKDCLEVSSQEEHHEIQQSIGIITETIPRTLKRHEKRIGRSQITIESANLEIDRHLPPWEE